MRSKEWLDATVATHTAWAVSRFGHVRFAAVQHYHMKNVHTGDDDHIGDAQNAHTGYLEGCLISNHTTLVHNRHAENTMDGGTLLSDVQDTIVLGRSLAAKRQETTFNFRFAAVQNYHMKNVHTGDDDHIGDAQNAHTGCGKKGCLTNNHLALVHNRLHKPTSFCPCIRLPVIASMEEDHPQTRWLYILLARASLDCLEVVP